MSTIWLISDTHFGHANILTFCKTDGTLLRPEFSSVEDMDEYMVSQWNSVVRPSDIVYHLGDVVMNEKHLPIVARLNGHKRVVLGNHDPYDMKKLTLYFEKVFSSRRLDCFLLTHIPVHVESLHKITANIHGHTHNNQSQWCLGPKYFNVSVEHHNYKPIALEDAKARILKEQAQ